MTGGSRVTFATGMAVIEAARDCDARSSAQRAAQIWGIPSRRGGLGERRRRNPSGANAGKFQPLSLARDRSQGSPTPAVRSSAMRGQRRRCRAGFATHIWSTSRSTPRPAASTVLRYTVCQDAGKAVHPSYVEGQMQGGAVQGIGWALNEEYIYDKDGRLENAGFLDYRMPVASDLPMIDTVIVEVPNPGHPYGVRGVGETPIVPPLAAVANAVSAATGVRLTELPMSPPQVLHALEQMRPAQAAE